MRCPPVPLDAHPCKPRASRPVHQSELETSLISRRFEFGPDCPGPEVSILLYGTNKFLGLQRRTPTPLPRRQQVGRPPCPVLVPLLPFWQASNGALCAACARGSHQAPRCSKTAAAMGTCLIMTRCVATIRPGAGCRSLLCCAQAQPLNGSGRSLQEPLRGTVVGELN